MANAGNKLHGIYGNQQFMDHLYRYGEMSNDIAVRQKLEMSAAIEKEIENALETCALHRVSSINICLSEIKSKTPGSEEWETYFNYIRWNQKIISGEFQFYMQQPSMEKHRGTISACDQLMRYVMNEFCNFTCADMSIINEYMHTYAMISSPHLSIKVLLQAGKLFVNFINILIIGRYCYEESDIKFADIEVQARVIIEKLSAKRCVLADSVKEVNEEFFKLRNLQDCLRTIHNESLEKALKLAHVRATETIFQATKRLILDAISTIQKRLNDGLRTAIKVGETIIHPFIHPVETAKNLTNCVLHPLQSMKALFTWAKESPWKCCAIIAGGMMCGAALVVLFDLLILDLAVTTFPLILGGGVIGGVTVPLSVATNRANELIKDAENEKLKLNLEFNNFKSHLKVQGRNIAAQALNENNIEW